MSRIGSFLRFAVVMVGVLASAHGATAGRSPTDADALSVRAIGGIVVHYPRGWKAAVTKDGTVVALAGPTGGGVRPAVTFFVVRGQRIIDEILDSAANGLGNKAPIELLGERHQSSSRWARYYLRGKGTTAEYVVIGVAQENGWVVTMVGVDAAMDPLLRAHAEVFQGLLTAIVFPIP